MRTARLGHHRHDALHGAGLTARAPGSAGHGGQRGDERLELQNVGHVGGGHGPRCRRDSHRPPRSSPARLTRGRGLCRRHGRRERARRALEIAARFPQAPTALSSGNGFENGQKTPCCACARLGLARYSRPVPRIV
jgi:hypothetical protein